MQVVFGGLALLFAVGFVGFGIGGEQSGGILDAVGLGGDGGESVSSQYEQQIDDAEQRLDEDPRDPRALTELARYRFLSGQDQLSFDEETGLATLTEETRGEWNAALDAWEQLLKTNPDQVDPQVAGQMICAYVPPLPQCQIQASAEGLDLEGAAETQRLIAEEDRGPAGYFQLAQFLYFEGDFKGGDEAAQKALARAEPSEREDLQKDLDSLASQARKFVKQARQAAEGAGGEAPGAPGLQDPFGGLGAGGTGSGVTPAP